MSKVIKLSARMTVLAPRSWARRRPRTRPALLKPDAVRQSRDHRRSSDAAGRLRDARSSRRSAATARGRMTSTAAETRALKVWNSRQEEGPADHCRQEVRVATSRPSRRPSARIGYGNLSQARQSRMDRHRPTYGRQLRGLLRRSLHRRDALIKFMTSHRLPHEAERHALQAALDGPRWPGLNVRADDRRPSRLELTSGSTAAGAPPSPRSRAAQPCATAAKNVLRTHLHHEVRRQPQRSGRRRRMDIYLLYCTGAAMKRPHGRDVRAATSRCQTRACSAT